MSGNTCPWCKYNNHGCDESDCDFKTLPYEKDAILDRLTIERKKIDGVRKKFSEFKGKELTDDLNRDLAWMLDVMKGMQIMVDRLVADFGMKNEEIQGLVGFNESKMSFVEKAKLMMKLRKMKELRRGK